jgi:hypothetical protein
LLGLTPPRNALPPLRGSDRAHRARGMPGAQARGLLRRGPPTHPGGSRRGRISGRTPDRLPSPGRGPRASGGNSGRLLRHSARGTRPERPGPVVRPPARREYERPSGRDLAEVSIVQFCHARLTIPPRHRILTRIPEPPHSFYVTNSQWSEDLLWFFPSFFAVLRVPRPVLSGPFEAKTIYSATSRPALRVSEPGIRCSALPPSLALRVRVKPRRPPESGIATQQVSRISNVRACRAGVAVRFAESLLKIRRPIAA